MGRTTSASDLEDMNLLKKGFALGIFILHCTFPFLVQAQVLQFNHQRLSVEDGLASREVLCGLQDQKGFLWFGTRNGLNRYDGKKFTLLTKRDGLQRNRVVGLAEDKNGNLWITYGDVEGSYHTDGKIDIYDPIGKKVIPLEEKFPELPFDQNGISYLMPNEQRDIHLLVKPNLVYRFTEEKGFQLVVKTDQTVEKLLGYSTYTPHANGASIAFNDLYFFLGNLLFINNDANKKISYINEEGLLEFVSPGKKDSSYQLIIEKYTQDGGPEIEYKPCDALTYSVLNNLDYLGGRWNDKFGPSILLPLKSGLFVFKDYRCTPLLPFPYELHTFSKNLSFFSDRQGNYWVCTPDGLHKFTPSYKRFEVLFNKEAYDTQNPLGNQVRCILADTVGNVWIGGAFWSGLLSTGGTVLPDAV